MCLSRKISEKIRIGSDITITVLDIRLGPKVRLGIEASLALPIHREEVFQSIVKAGAVIPSVGEMADELARLRAENAELRLRVAALEVAT